MTKLSLLETRVIEEFLYAYSKKIKAALNPLRGASSFSLKEKKREKKSVLLLKKPNEYSLKAYKKRLPLKTAIF